MNSKIRFSYNKLRGGAFLYLLLPVLIYLLTFLRPVYAIVSSVALLASFWLSVRNDNTIKKTVSFGLMEIILIAAVSLVWSWLGGQGGFFYQTSDWNERNAVFRDLISNDWPVYYPVTNTVLSYYVGHWLPAALIGRTVYHFFGNMDVAWKVGNIALWLWTSTGVFLTFMLLFRAAGAKRPSQRVFAILVMVFFSGLDIIGTIIDKWSVEDYFRILHLEWWAEVYQFSSPTTCLFWVFNQAVPAWIAILCFINENTSRERIRNYGLIMVSALLSAPLPCVGMFFYMLASIIFSLVKHIKKKCFVSWLKDCFSLGNVLMVLIVFPCIAALLLLNAAVGGLSEAADAVPPQLNKPLFICIYVLAIVVLYAFSNNEGIRKKTIRFRSETLSFVKLFGTLAILLGVSLYMRLNLLVKFPLFILFEAGIYLILLYPFFRDDYLFYVTALVLGICPLIRVGISMDFCMRVSIPGIMMLIVYYVKALLNTWNWEWKPLMTVCKVLLIIMLLIGCCTPFMEIYRGFYLYDQRGNADEIGTLNQYHQSGSIYGNFVSDSYESSFFFSHLSKLRKDDMH